MSYHRTSGTKLIFYNLLMISVAKIFSRYILKLFFSVLAHENYKTQTITTNSNIEQKISIKEVHSECHTVNCYYSWYTYMDACASLRSGYHKVNCYYSWYTYIEECVSLRSGYHKVNCYYSWYTYMEECVSLVEGGTSLNFIQYMMIWVKRKKCQL